MTLFHAQIECHLSTRFAFEIPKGFSERICSVLCYRSLIKMFLCWSAIWNSSFETFNLKGRRGSRERKESAALHRECWRALNLFSVLGKSLPERNLGFLGLRDGRRPSPPSSILYMSQTPSNYYYYYYYYNYYYYYYYYY